MKIKTDIKEVVFTEFVDIDGHYHFAADWDDTKCRYTTKLNKQVRKILEKKAIEKFGYSSGNTGSSVYVVTPAA